MEKKYDTLQLNKKYKIFKGKELGRGGFGALYQGQNVETNENVAIKYEFGVLGVNSHLYSEAKILSKIKGGIGVPEVYEYIKKDSGNYMVMELLGKSIDSLFNLCDKKFKMKTIMQIGIQMVKRVEYLHRKGFIHRDIKPANFLIGKNEKKSIIYLIDYGLAKPYINRDTRLHIPFKRGKGLTGTARFVSLFTHKGIEQSRRDDIEGIAYNLIYLAKGSLPWQGIKVKKKKEKHSQIFEIKKKTTPEELCRNLPIEFLALLNYSRTIDFEEMPYYRDIISMFESYMKKNNLEIDGTFDWDSKDSII